MERPRAAQERPNRGPEVPKEPPKRIQGWILTEKGAVWVAFWTPVDFGGRPNMLFVIKSTSTATKRRSGGGSGNGSKQTGNRVPKWLVFGRSEPQKSCSRVHAVRI